MAWLNGTQQALAAGRGVFLARLVFLDILSAPKHLWEGFGSAIVDGDTYAGDGSLVSIGDIPVDQNVDAGNVELGLSGVASWAIDLVKDRSLALGREAEIWGQFFGEDLQPSDDPFLMFSGTMDVPRWRANGPGSRSIVLPIEGDNSDRNRARHTFFSVKDQAARYPADTATGLEFILELKNKKVRWPY